MRPSAATSVLALALSVLTAAALWLLPTPALAQPAAPGAAAPGAPAAAPSAAPPGPSAAPPVRPAGDGDGSGASGEGAPPPIPKLPPTEMDKASGLPIARISIQGTRRIPREDVVRYLRERVGDGFVPKALSRDVRELWASGYFDDIQVDLKRVRGGVHLTFLLRERPTIAKIEFEGNSAIGDSELDENVPIKAASVLSRPQIQRTIQKIRDMYAEKGYFLAEASSKIEPAEDNEVVVRFTIKEYKPVSVRRITFIGNEHISTDELRQVMFTGNAGILAFGSGGPFRQDAFERDIAIISSLYYDQGFLAAQIHAPRIMLTPDRTGIEVSITIDEGPRFRIRRLRVYERGEDGREVDPIGGRRNLRNMVQARSGDYFNRAQLLKDLNAVRSLYRNAGYANADARPQTRVDQKKNLVDVIVPVVRGPKVYFERIEVRGNDKTRDKVIRRELEVFEGEPFSEEKLDRSRRRVTALGYFERVDISMEQGSAPDRMNVFIEVAERPTGTFQVGVGFSSIENFIATAQIQQQNLFGNGQSLSLQAQVSGLRQLINIQLYEPYFLDSQFSASINLFDQLRAFNDFSQSSRGGSATLGYRLINPTLLASVTYTASLDEVSTQPRSTLLGGTSSTVSIFRSLPLANLFNDGLTSSIKPALTWDTRNNRIFPTEGVYLRASSELSSSIFGADNEFLRHKLTGRFYYDLGASFVLKANAVGTLVTSPTDEGVPIFARVFLGGILDVRGFRFRSIGPRLPLTSSLDPNSLPITNGANIGGNLSYYQNLEFEFPLVQSVGVRGVVFTDLGNAWNTESNYCDATTGSATIPDVQNPCFEGLESLARVRTSWGFGLRWFSPLGPLRFEWGFPFAPLPYEEDNRFEFTIGNFF